MFIKYLGTGAEEGYPAAFCSCASCERARAEGGRSLRRRSGMVIDGALLIDLPPDIVSLADDLKINMCGIADLLITSPASDHFYARELRNVREPNIQRRSKLRVHGSAAVGRSIVRFLKDESSNILEFHLALKEIKMRVGEFEVTPLKPRNGGGALIYIIEKDGKRALYGNDTGFFPEETWDYISGVKFDFVSLDCGFVPGSAERNHMDIEDIITVRKRMLQQGSAGAGTVFVCTLFSHRMGFTHREICERVLPFGFKAAYDGMEITI